MKKSRSSFLKSVMLFRVTESQKSLIESAALASQKTYSQFLRDSALTNAYELLKRDELNIARRAEQ